MIRRAGDRPDDADRCVGPPAIVSGVAPLLRPKSRGSSYRNAATPMPGSRERRFTRLQWVPALPSLTLVPPAPIQRPRRRRRTEALRRLVRETSWLPAISSCPSSWCPAAGSSARSARCRACSTSRWISRSTARRSGRDVGIPAVLLFGLPAAKDERAPRTSPTTASCSARCADPRAEYRAAHRHRRLLLRVHRRTATAACSTRRDAVDNDATLAAARAGRGGVRRRGRRHRRAERDDGRAGRGDPRGARRRRPPRRRRSCRYADEVRRRRSTARSARRRRSRRRSATARRTRWTAGERARGGARGRAATRPRAPTC